jgi:hypothetical protein
MEDPGVPFDNDLWKLEYDLLTAELPPLDMLSR